MKTYKASELHKITRRTNIRDYAYSVWVTKKTGRVIKLRAGCRRWSSFWAANDHYASDAKDWLGRPAKWSDEWLKTLYGQPYNDAIVYRREARAVLDRLAADVNAYQCKLRAAKRKVRRRET